MTTDANDVPENTPHVDKKQPKIPKIPTSRGAKELNPNVVSLKDKGNVDYDWGMVNNFIDTVFHTLEEGEQILTWYQKRNTPSFPKEFKKTKAVLQKTNLPRTFYYGTSTVHLAEDGKLYNRKSQFDRLHVVVLDDIGTKIDPSILPEDLMPNYIIESSEGNFQYGYILKEPIEDIALADALVHLVYTSGFSDGGGKMPTKVVRLPCGINGKEGDKGLFRVRLTELNNDYWTPAELLEVMDVGVSWDEVLKDVNAAKLGRTAQMSGTSEWSPIKSRAGSLNGTVDQMLEWLYDQDLVTNDNGDWVTIQCPWHDEHSDNANTAGYSPVGRGGKYSTVRSFNCFHDHCKDRTGNDFLQWAITNGAPRVPLIDHVADLIADYAYVSTEDAAFRLRGVEKPTGIGMGAFKNTYPKKVPIHDLDGKIKMVNESSMWLTAPNRLTLHGAMMNPAKAEKIIEHDGQKYLNLYAPPTWGKGTYNQAHVDRFLSFIDYLIVNQEERDYFLQWLAAKAQRPTFKGCAVLMVAPVQGTGRTTLTDMVTTLFTPENVKKVTFPQLCGASEAGSYNDWQESLMVTCDEIMSDTSKRHHVYETMKELFDPRPKTILINTKYGAQRHTTVYTSYLLLTNHTDAVGQLGGDRRVYVVKNNTRPESPKFFTELNEWLEVTNGAGKPAWAESVWRWLQTRTPDFTMLNAPAPLTEAKRVMVEETTSVYDHTADALVEVLNGVIPNSRINQLCIDILENRGDRNAEVGAKVVEKIIKSQTEAFATPKRVLKKVTRVRISRDLLNTLILPADVTNREEMIGNCIDRKLPLVNSRFEDEHQLILDVNSLVDERL